MPDQSLPPNNSAPRSRGGNDYNAALRIQCVIHSLAGGGAERVLASLASRLASRGHDVQLVTLGDARDDRYAVAQNVQRIELDVMQDSRGVLAALRNNLRRLRAVRRTVRRYRPDVVLSFCDATNVLVLLATAGMAVPVVVSERSDPAKHPMGRCWARLRPWAYRRAARLVALSDAAAVTLAPWNRRPVAVIPSAVDPPPHPASANSAPADPAAAPIMLGVGRLSHEKGFDRLIAAFASVAAEHPGWRLEIAGDGPLRAALQQQITASGLADRIELVGWRQDVASLYARADLFVLPSRYEGFPAALLEAMAWGVASVAVDCDSGPRQIVRDGVDGVLCSAEQLEERLRQMMGDRSLRLRLASRAVEVVDRFGWPAMVRRYERVLREAATDRSRPS
ncbi:glycosyltransferase family 4 protein [Roseimaritima sediminicola]|uniref:glycosyltransferase family 4 protein n=1 Tax=Roseimaritima sediminicola TaxID=2662066 RepID=UPI001298416F|nr:glycosyltransferase family 4 protein [Roseimaritima sediminicola]